MTGRESPRHVLEEEAALEPALLLMRVLQGQRLAHNPPEQFSARSVGHSANGSDTALPSFSEGPGLGKVRTTGGLEGRDGYGTRAPRSFSHQPWALSSCLCSEAPFLNYHTETATSPCFITVGMMSGMYVRMPVTEGAQTASEPPAVPAPPSQMIPPRPGGMQTEILSPAGKGGTTSCWFWKVSLSLHFSRRA